VFESRLKIPERIKSFGEIGVVTTKSNFQGKLKNCGTFCMFVGYSVDNDHDL
jgi:hypothetical protein